MAVSYMHMEEWLFPPYEGLVEAAAEGLTSSSLESAEEEHVHNKENAKSAENDIKLAIRCHPRYPELLRAHMSFMKVGASPHQVAEFDEILEQQYNLRPETAKASIGSNPELDQFMTTYCNALNSYVNELKKTFHEAMDYCKKQEEELCLISGEVDIVEKDDWEEDYCYGDMEEAESCIQIDPNAGEKELKQMLMRKYGMYIKGLTQENLKKKKKGKLPKEARQKLFDWWNKHLDHPYPTEVEKADLAQSTELDPKQINNWFINQRKRHWNPTTTGKGESSKQGEARANTEEVYSA